MTLRPVVFCLLTDLYSSFLLAFYYYFILNMYEAWILFTLLRSFGVTPNELCFISPHAGGGTR